MTEVAFAISGKISDYLVAPIGRQLGYLFQFNGNVKTLKNELETLRNLKDDVRQEVEVAGNNVDKILNTVQTWLDRVGSVEDEAQCILEDKARFPKGCFNNWFLNWKSRYVLSRKAKKRTRDIIVLQQEGKFPKVSLQVPPILFMGSTSTAFNSREVYLEEIIEKIKDENISMIGICGMGGVGKTTMAEDVFKRVKEENMFDDYATTVVSQKADMAKVQNDIAEMLSLTIKENNPVLRASRLNQRLVGKKVFIILDDVWEEFDLRALGITLQDSQSKCKIVFTSRTRGLWMDFRSRRHELPLDPLPDKESWNLFKEKMGDFLDENPDLVPTAEQIVKECAGLPLALVTLGSALLGKGKYTWNDTLVKLRTISGLQLKVYESIRLSYDYLVDEEAKSLFLLCSLFEEDSPISVESLVNIGMGLRLFKGIDSVEMARDRVFALVEYLQSRCLVSKGKTSITVHDVVRDVSKSIASTEKGSLVIEHCVTLETSLEHCSWISVMSKETKKLPSLLQSPRLELLRCRTNDLQIPDSYFEGMVKLQVVDIMCSYPQFQRSHKVLKLPSSLQSLTNLHTLCLGNFMLEGFAAIRFLQSLEILRIADKFIQELPIEIGQLTKLRLLDMSDCEELKKIRSGIISGLSNLQELYLGGLNIDWGAEETEEGNNAAHVEFGSLSNLHILHIVIKDPRMLQGTPLLQNLKKYQIQIGDEECRFIKASRNYERIESISNVALAKDFDFLLHNSEALLLKGESTKSLVSELVRQASQNIKYLEIHDTDTPEYLANVMDRTEAPFLVSKLESLRLYDVNNLQQIINGPLVAGYFVKLKKLDVRDCKQLRNIFRLSNVVDVLHLEKLRVYDCESMGEIICWEGREADATNKLQFPRLKKLEINGNSLVCFCKGANVIEFHHLETLRLVSIPVIECIVSCSDELSLNSIFPHKVLFPKLVEMNLRKLKNMKEIWFGQLQSGSFYNLSMLNINRCNSLEYVFSPYMAKYLVHLHTLSIDDCPSLKEIIVNGPLLDESLVNLRELTVRGCNQLRKVFHLSTAVDIVNLQELCIINCGSIEEVISWEGRPEDATSKLHFPKLQSLVISNASLICFCNGAMEIEFHQLRRLYLSNISAVECLISNTNEYPLKSIFPHKVSLPELERMELHNLENMKEIWRGQLQLGSFYNLSELEIHECDGLEYLFSPCTARYLVHLRKLVIAKCKNLKEVVSVKKEVDGIEEHTRSILPKLEDVKLYKLLALERFYHEANDIEFPVLMMWG